MRNSRRHRLTATLRARAVLTASTAALISVLVTAAVAFPTAIRSANDDARQSLIGQTEVVADLIGPLLTVGKPVGEQRMVNQLRRQNISVYLIRAGQADRSGLPPRIIKKIASDQSVNNDAALVNGRAVLVEGRALGNGYGVVLTRPAVTGTTRTVWGRLWLALIVGLGAGLAAGTLLARRLARPFRHAAAAANRLTAGDRQVRLDIEAPVEAEDLAHALNNLAAALATSEGRQRDFLLSISHGLRTPLTTIKGYAEALADGVVGPEGSQRAGQTMLHEAEHLDRLVADLLALARLEAADFAVELIWADLTALVRAAAEAWGARCATVGVVLRLELPAQPVGAYTDPGRTRQIIDGLMENALRVVPTGAPLVLAVRPPATSADRFADVEVRDGGPGFTDEDLAVAFERGALYQRYRGVRKVGSGLGLALASRLVRRLGGTIEAGHAAEGGARFTVRLPTAEPYQTRTSG